MGKLESNKQQKRTSLLDTAFKLFTTQGVSKTSIAEISQKAGIHIRSIPLGATNPLAIAIALTD